MSWSVLRGNGLVSVGQGSTSSEDPGHLLSLCLTPLLRQHERHCLARPLHSHTRLHSTDEPQLTLLSFHWPRYLPIIAGLLGQKIPGEELWEAEAADHLRSGVRDQPIQHGETSSLLKIQKLAGLGGACL